MRSPARSTIGSLVPKSAGFEEGDQVVVVGGWGDETCRHCHEGNTQICPHGKWPGFGPYGGYAEYVPVPVQYLIKIDKRYKLKAEELAADHVIDIKGKSIDDIRKELVRATGKGEIDAVIDCAGAEEMIRLGFGLLSVGAHYS